jgi:hypothetical protein
MAGVEQPSRPFYKHPLFLGVAAVGAVGLGYYAYKEYVQPMLEGDDGNVEDAELISDDED